MLFGLGIIIMILAGCSGSKENAEASGKADRYIPLAIGNTWGYRFDAGDIVRKQLIQVVGTTKRDGTTWFLVETRFEGQPTITIDTSLMRNVGHQHILYLTYQQEEMTLIDFGRTEIDSVELSLGYVRQQNQEKEIGKHTFTDCVVVASGHVDAEVGTYAPGVGLIESWWFRGKKQLAYAKIDGKEHFFE